MKDLLGKAILDFQTNNNPQNIITETDISESEEMDINYLFRKYEEMPKIEQKALDLAKGKILDVGCGAGAHSLHLIKKGFDVKAIDISPNSIEACRLRGIQAAEVKDILDLKDETFDTILLLMNGTGIFGKLINTTKYLTHLKTLLNPGGQILIDSSDLIYMFDTDEDGGVWIPMENKDYYGELTFTVEYKGEIDNPFNWLYLDYNTLQNAAHANGFECDLIYEGDNCDYLAKLYI
ncbi:MULTISPECIES: class I SAM-dependent methyltransferase [Myroides]|uniref:Methyltransferase domain-containing protein n=1 Tax=Myroides albus TaxID=2562892 RepID=A0A6I3LGV3_9FLAO|nr:MULTISPECIES: class I SAM-dependent methyltransferase [Myroides]MTG97034.1 methyltransferase domain-containing protein [Myroides albus]MVX36349.1 methyltransferase domain-containing protein [Myroides sp. LoEW2-1]UVD78542.1 class I SAM-dependent methyltransferase [Myroides albus]